MHLDISDIITAREEVIRLLKQYVLNSEPTDHDNLPRNALESGIYRFNRMLKRTWEEETPTFQQRDNMVLYHVCRQDQKKRILHHGIYHDLSPTLTASLVGAFARANLYHAYKLPSAILKARVPSQVLQFRYIDQMGPGFLPLATKTRDEIPPDALPDELVNAIFDLRELPTARWLDPAYFKGVLYTTSDATVQPILDALEQCLRPYRRHAGNHSTVSHVHSNS